MSMYAGMDKKTYKEYTKKYPLHKNKAGLGIREIYNLDQKYGKGNWSTKGGPGYAASESIENSAPSIVKERFGTKQFTVYSKLPEPKPEEAKVVEETPTQVDPGPKK